MPRRARNYLSGVPYHIVQRGNNREACFIEEENYQYYLELWQTVSRRYGLAVHAYGQMNNHVHFLVSPTERDVLHLRSYMSGGQLHRSGQALPVSVVSLRRRGGQSG